MPQAHEVRFEVSVHALIPRDTDVSSTALTNILDGIETAFAEVGGETTITMARSTRGERLPAEPEAPTTLGGYR